MREPLCAPCPPTLPHPIFPQPQVCHSLSPGGPGGWPCCTAEPPTNGGSSDGWTAPQGLTGFAPHDALCSSRERGESGQMGAF